MELLFSNEEFDIMVQELLFQKPISFDMLCRIANKALHSQVRSICANDATLRGRGFEDDLMQEIQIRLMKTTVASFLLKNMPEGQVNADAKGFSAWMRKVAENLGKDFAEKIRRQDFRSVPLDHPEIQTQLVTSEQEDIGEKAEQLREAFCIVLASDASVYKILTWIAQFVFIICMDVTKIDSTDIIVSNFEKKTLFEMYDMLLKLSERVLWVEISAEQDERIRNALQQEWKDGILCGEALYQDFFMKQNGEKSGKKSISDWVSRMNKTIQKKYSKNKKNDGEGAS